MEAPTEGWGTVRQDTTGLRRDITVNGKRYPLVTDRQGLAWRHEEDAPLSGLAPQRVESAVWDVGWASGAGETYRFNPQTDGYAFSVGWDATKPGRAKLSGRRNTVASSQVLRDLPTFGFEEAALGSVTSTITQFPVDDGSLTSAATTVIQTRVASGSGGSVGPPSTIAETPLFAEKDTVAGTSFTTTATIGSNLIEPNALVLVTVMCTGTSAGTIPNAPTGGGMTTWTQYQTTTVTVDGVLHRITVFHSQQATPGAPAVLVVTFPGTVGNYRIVASAYTGVTIGGNGADALLQNKTGSVASSFSLQVPLSLSFTTAIDPENAVYAVFGLGSAGTATFGSPTFAPVTAGYTTTESIVVNNHGLAAVWKAQGTDLVRGAWTVQSLGSGVAGIAIEIEALQVATTTFSTDPYLPSANALALLTVVGTLTGGSVEPTASGGNMASWTKVDSQAFGTDHRVTVFRALRTTVATDAAPVVISFSAAQDVIRWSISEYTNVDVTSGAGGSSAVAQYSKNSGTGTTASSNLTTPAGASFGAFGTNGVGMDVEGGYTAMDFDAPAGTILTHGVVNQGTLFTEFKTGTDTSVTATDANSNASTGWGAIAIEIKSSVGSVYQTDAPGAGMSVTAGRLVLCAVYMNAVSVGTLTSVEGLGLSWTVVDTIAISSTHRIALWKAVATQNATGQLTFTCSAAQTCVRWAVSEFSGVDTTTPVIQSKTGSSASSDTLTITLTSAVGTTGMTYAVFGAGTASTVVKGSAFTQVYNTASSSATLLSEYVSPQSQTADATLATVSTVGSLIVFESPYSISDESYARRVATLTGSTWANVSNPGSASQACLSFAKSLGGILFRAYGNNGYGYGGALAPSRLDRSTDNGVTWTTVFAQQTDSGDFWGVTGIDRAADGALWLCASLIDQTNLVLPYPSVWKSTDGGANWTKIYEDTTASRRRMIDIACHPGNASVVIVVGDRSPGLGQTWSTTDGSSFTVSTTLPIQSVVGERQVVILSTGRVICMNSASGDMYYSDDNGTSWTEAGATFSTYAYDLLATPGDALFASGGSALSPIVLRSLDAGVTWTTVLDDTIDAAISMFHGLAYSANDDALYVCTEETDTTGRVLKLASATQVVVGATSDVTNNLDSLFTERVGRQGVVLHGEVAADTTFVGIAVEIGAGSIAGGTTGVIHPYILNGQYCYKMTVTGTTISAPTAKDLESPSQAGNPAKFGSDAANLRWFIPAGQTSRYWTLQANSGNDSWARGSDEAQSFARLQDGTVAKLLRGHDFNQSNISANGDAWDADNYDVGDVSGVITNMVDTGTSVYVSKTDGLYRFLAEGVTQQIIQSNPDDNNGCGLLAIQGTDAVLYNDLAGLWLFDGANLPSLIGPDANDLNQPITNVTHEPRGGRHLETAKAGKWYYSVYQVTDTTTKTYILAGYRMGDRWVWHTPWRYDGVVRGVFPDTSGRLWSAFVDDQLIGYHQLDEDGCPDPGRNTIGHGAASENYDLYLPEITFPAKAYLQSVELLLANADSSVPVFIRYDADLAGYLTLGATASGTSTSTTQATLTDTTQAWTTNQWVGNVLTATATGYTATITSNTETVLSFSAWSTAGDPADAIAYTISAGKAANGLVRYFKGTTAVGAYRWRLIIRAVASDVFDNTDTTPLEVRAARLFFWTRSQKTDRVHFTVDCGARLSNGAMDSDAKTRRDELKALARGDTSGPAVACLDPDGNTLYLGMFLASDLMLQEVDGELHWVIDCQAMEWTTASQ